MTSSAPRDLIKFIFFELQTAVTFTLKYFRSCTAEEPIAPVAPYTKAFWPLLIFDALILPKA